MSRRPLSADQPAFESLPTTQLVIFDPLQKATLRAIARLTLRELTSRLQLKEIAIDVSDAALDVLTDLGYSPEYGARPLKRVVQKELETPLARGLISGDYLPGDTIAIDADMDAVRLTMAVRERRGAAAPGGGEAAAETDMDTDSGAADAGLAAAA